MRCAYSAPGKILRLGYDTSCGKILDKVTRRIDTATVDKYNSHQCGRGVHANATQMCRARLLTDRMRLRLFM